MMGLLFWFLAGVGQMTGEAFGREMSLELGTVTEQPVSINDYVLNAGDSLLVMVKGSFSYSYPTRISPAGQLVIMLPSARKMTTFGQTFGEVSLVNLEAVGYVEIVDVPVRKARRQVAEAFEKFIRPVEIDFVLIGARLCKINVLGDVQWPGSYLVTPFMRVEDGIDLAGGIISMGSVSNIALVRRSGDSLRVNLRRYREDGELDANPPLSDGDIIHVPKMERFVLLRGAVLAKEAVDEPSIQAVLIADTLRRAFHAEHWLEFEKKERVCGFLASRAVLIPQSDLAHCYIQRGDERIFFDMQEYLASGQGENPRLEHGDVVTVPRSEQFVYVTGELKKPGPVIYNEAFTLNQYLGQAGGFSSTANLRAIRVVYPDGRTRRAHPDMQLEPGATIFVPRKPLYGVQDWVGLTASVLSLVAVILTFGE
ncbi:MAG: SLBB domain-containing protein [candidate division WOR-3 bacterium]|nr:SLBB domain-containing protein [candidate division WOR-3 bacterium]